MELSSIWATVKIRILLFFHTCREDLHHRSVRTFSTLGLDLADPGFLMIHSHNTQLEDLFRVEENE